MSNSSANYWTLSVDGQTVARGPNPAGNVALTGLVTTVPVVTYGNPNTGTDTHMAEIKSPEEKCMLCDATREDGPGIFLMAWVCDSCKAVFQYARQMMLEDMARQVVDALVD